MMPALFHACTLAPARLRIYRYRSSANDKRTVKVERKRPQPASAEDFGRNNAAIFPIYRVYWRTADTLPLAMSSAMRAKSGYMTRSFSIVAHTDRIAA